MCAARVRARARPIAAIMGFMRARRSPSTVAPAHPLEEAAPSSRSCANLSSAEIYQVSLRQTRSRSASSLSRRKVVALALLEPIAPSHAVESSPTTRSSDATTCVTISHDVGIQCSRMWSWNGLDVAPPCSSSLMARLERCTGDFTDDARSKAVQVELPWATHQIRRPRVINPVDMSPPPKTEIERKLKRWLSRQRSTCSCTLVHVCAMAALQPILASPDAPFKPV